MTNTVRTFDTGATRNLDDNKFDYEGFLSPLVMDAFGEYMHSHRMQADGKIRDSDNWQKGIPQTAYMKSAFRHFMHWWTSHRGYPAYDECDNPVTIEDALCGVLFNVQGYLHEYLKRKLEIRTSEQAVVDAAAASPSFVGLREDQWNVKSKARTVIGGFRC